MTILLRRPRLIVEITEEQRDALTKHLQWGIRRRVFSNVIDTMIEAFETDSKTALAGFISGKLKIVVTDEPRKARNGRSKKLA